MFKTLCKLPNAHDDGIWSVVWSKQEQGNDIVTASVDETVKIWRWNAQESKLQSHFKFEGHRMGVHSVDIDSTGRTCASSSLDSNIRLWDMSELKLIRSIDVGPMNAWTVAFSVDGSFIATGTGHGDINLIATATGEKQMSISTHGQFILSVAISPNGKILASSGFDGIVNLFEVGGSFKLLHKIEAHTMPIRSIAFSPDSQLLATASDDGSIKIFDPTHAHLSATLSGHSSRVLGVAWNPDSVHFASASSDKTVKIWSTSTRQCLHTFDDHTDQVWSVSFDRTGSRLVSVGDDNAIFIHECPL